MRFSVVAVLLAVTGSALALPAKFPVAATTTTTTEEAATSTEVPSDPAATGGDASANAWYYGGW
ncbi:hypothetical protein M408DRAFT_19336 [Serendipita vermifera MAFF 305830]|uniref:Uncharacterized protein n=1 Tax=Serendipita vermifera MAFF 305830 TaxID=933852 RepID=A0A0C2X8Q4_SERVB|nr:hypothetical protein M408DRAFT_19336 [Serendipita vermifera MAFF 305830]